MKYERFIIPFLILVIVILFLWPNGNKEFSKSERKFKDSIANLLTVRDIQEIQIVKSRDTIIQLRSGLKALQLSTAQRKSEKVKVLTQTKIIVADTILQAYKVVRERLTQDSTKITILEQYSGALEAENLQLNRMVKSQDYKIKSLNAIDETNKLMIAQLNSRHENDKKIIKDERKKKRKLKAVLGIGGAILLFLVAV